jgi:UDPglucose--hexose-1-phosphate uridylyltransferase
MSEIRQDPTIKEWVIIASERRKRLSDFVHQVSKPEKPPFVSSCPYCPGNEKMTPTAVLCYTDSSAGGWQIRVVNNRFPAVTPKGDTSRHLENGCFLSLDGVGFHEVIVETPAHNKPLALMNDAEIAQVLRAYRQRYEAMTQAPFIKSIIIFKNTIPLN